MNLLNSIKRQIPNFITLGNLTCGVVASYMASQGFLWPAAVYILLGIFLDFFDGLAARLLGVASPVGKELDSLADVVTSGVAPGLILFQILGMQSEHNGAPEYLEFISYVALLMPAFAAYRLAKFNLDERQHHSFLGLPAPSNAIIWVGVAVLFDGPLASDAPFLYHKTMLIGLAVLSLVTDILMIGEVPMFSLKFNFKDLSWKSNRVQYIFLLGCLLLIIFLQLYAISLIILWYTLLSILTQRKTPAND